jgi:hypothetical protein
VVHPALRLADELHDPRRRLAFHYVAAGGLGPEGLARGLRAPSRRQEAGAGRGGRGAGDRAPRATRCVRRPSGRWAAVSSPAVSR